MKRWCFNIFAAVSLLLLVATVAAWIESYRAYDYFTMGNASGKEFTVASDSGRIGFSYARYDTKEDDPMFPAPHRGVEHWHHIPNWVGLNWGSAGWKWGGFNVEYRVPNYRMEARGLKRQTGTTTGIRFPYWFLVLTTLMLPVFRGRTWWFQRELDHRKSHGLCAQCGYDLRAHQPGQKCPECGTIIPNATMTLQESFQLPTSLESLNPQGLALHHWRPFFVWSTVYWGLPTESWKLWVIESQERPAP